MRAVPRVVRLSAMAVGLATASGDGGNGTRLKVTELRELLQEMATAVEQFGSESGMRSSRHSTRTSFALRQFARTTDNPDSFKRSHVLFHSVAVLTSGHDMVTRQQTASQTDAAAKTSKSGGAYSGAASVAPGAWVYQITKTGLALQLSMQGTKYYKGNDLNKP